MEGHHDVESIEAAGQGHGQCPLLATWFLLKGLVAALPLKSQWFVMSSDVKHGELFEAGETRARQAPAPSKILATPFRLRAVAARLVRASC